VTATIRETLLQQLRPSDRLQYRGVAWDVIDYSTYRDAKSYQTEEWLLQSKQGKEYYLLREVDPDNPDSLVHWYLAEEIYQPKLFVPDFSKSVTMTNLWQDMQRISPNYPALKLFDKTYYFESSTKGEYNGDWETSSRLTWDYWDKKHQQNLAIEAWLNGELHIYLSTVVNPQAFSNIQKRVVQDFSGLQLRSLKILAACILTVVGFLLLVFG
jgi:hypothetical protein